MKTSLNIFKATLLFTVLLLTCNSLFSQSKTSNQPIQKTTQLSVSIKVYEGGCKELKSLLVHNPNHHNLFFYDSAPYSVRWYQDGQLIGHGAFLKSVNGQHVTAVINNWTTGWSASINYYVGHTH